MGDGVHMRLRRAIHQAPPAPAAWTVAPDSEEVVVIHAARAGELAGAPSASQVEAA